VEIFPRPGEEDPSTFRCTECEGEQKDAPVMDLSLVKGMRGEGLDFRDGTILDPRDGSTYNAFMELSPDGRGYLGIPILGQTEVCTALLLRRPRLAAIGLVRRNSRGGALVQSKCSLAIRGIFPPSGLRPSCSR
jgi:hypothetical protein